MAQTFHRSFDYIVVGGSPAASVLATGLAEDPKTTVCLLEPSESVTAYVTVPASETAEYDVLESFGAKGWNSTSLSSHFDDTLSEDTGTQEGDFLARLRAAFKSAGIPHRDITPSKAKQTPPIECKANLEIITGAHVTRLVAKVIAEDGDPWNALELDPNAPTLVIHGVQYSKDGQLFTAPPRKEVLLCAGAEKTVQILQLSGIGDPPRLKSLGIHHVLDLPSIGKNYQVQVSCPFTVELNAPSDETVLLSSFVIDNTALANALDVASSPALESQKRWLLEGKVPLLELSVLPSECYLSLNLKLVHPFSRGSVHISSTDPSVEPDIDRGALTNDTDVAILVEAIKLCRKLFATDDLALLVTKEISPGAQIQSGEELKEYVRDNFTVASKPVGTTVMVSRDQAGVVASDLKIYGAENLRVVDESILPLQFTASPLGVATIIAKRAVDIIKGRK